MKQPQTFIYAIIIWMALSGRFATAEPYANAGGSDNAITVEIGISGMHCSKVTANEKALDGNPRNEVYILVILSAGRNETLPMVSEAP